MYPAARTMTSIAIMILSVVSMTGCEEKRLHGSTLSGAPGDAARLDGAEQATTADAQGLKNELIDESNLGGGMLASDTNPTPVAEAVTSADSTSTQAELQPGSTMPDSRTDSGNEGFPLQEGSGLNTQSSSSPTSGDLPPASFSDLGGGGNEMGNISAQDSSLKEPATSMVVTQGDTDSRTNDNMEEVSGILQVAKAEPSDALREQLDRMKKQELAAATAGLEDVFFQFDSWTLTGEGKQALERNMGWIRDDPTATLLIEGHADQRGTQAYNMVLGKRRAVAIRDYLNELGVDQNRLSVISYGKDKPFCQDPTEVCYQLNRRGHLLVQNP